MNAVVRECRVLQKRTPEDDLIREFRFWDRDELDLLSQDRRSKEKDCSPVNVSDRGRVWCAYNQLPQWFKFRLVQKRFVNRDVIASGVDLTIRPLDTICLVDTGGHLERKPNLNACLAVNRGPLFQCRLAAMSPLGSLFQTFRLPH